MLSIGDKLTYQIWWPAPAPNRKAKKPKQKTKPPSQKKRGDDNKITSFLKVF